MIKYGILSTASIVERYVKGINESQYGKAYAIASRSRKKAKEKADALGIPHYYGSYEELYNDDNIDIIYIPVMNGLHYDCCKQALLHNKHVVVEKPFVLEVDQAVELFELARERHLFLMEAQKCLFLPVTKKVKEMVDMDIIGDIRYLEFKAGFPGRFPYDHWMYNLKQGGGSLYGSATYTIEYLQFLFNEPDMTITGTYVESPTGSDDLCDVQLHFNHILAQSTIAMNVPLKNEMVIYGDKGYIEVPYFWKSSDVYVTLHDGESIHYKFPFQSEFVYEINHINDCLLKGLIESPVMNKEKTIQTVRLVDEMYKTWKKKS